jgi:hypothetical protein
MRHKRPTERRADELQKALRQGKYQECLNEIQYDRRLVEYLPPAFFRELALNIYPINEFDAHDVLAIMTTGYPTFEDIAQWLPQPSASGSKNP